MLSLRATPALTRGAQNDEGRPVERTEEGSMSRSRRPGGMLLFWAAVLIVGLIIWSKVRIVILVPIKIGVFVLFALGLVFVVFFFLRAFFRR
jgi:hypothetical protein